VTDRAFSLRFALYALGPLVLSAVIAYRRRGLAIA
jgi:hypothetical protein